MTPSNDSPSLSTTKRSSSWKPMGSTRLVFSSGEGEMLSSNGALECSLSSSTTAPSDGIPRTIMSKRIISCPRLLDNDCFLLQSDSTKDKDTSLHMGTINTLLLSLKSGMVFQDANDSSRYFFYAPRSLHTASLMEYNPKQESKASTPASSRKKQVNTKSNTNVVNDKENKQSNEQPQQQQEPPPLPVMEPVDTTELKKLHGKCLEGGDEPNPLEFCRLLAVSVNEEEMGVMKELLVTSTQIQEAGVDKDRRHVELQAGMRLALASSRRFLKLHHELVYKSISNKKLRKKTKRSTPQQVLQDQVVNLLSLLAIRCESPQEFRLVVQQLCVGVSEELVQVVYNHFELNGDKEETMDEEQVPVVAAPAPAKTEPERSIPMLASLPPVKPKEEDTKAPEAKETSLVPKSLALTAARSSRKNSLVPNQRRKYVGSHFGTRLSNASSLFRQVKVAAPRIAATAKVETKRARPIQLDPRPSSSSKRPRTISFPPAQRVTKKNKRVISETPAKRQLAYPCSPGAGEELMMLSPMGRSDSQNARLVAKEALAAARRNSQR